jgi:hypothetical protein
MSVNGNFPTKKSFQERTIGSSAYSVFMETSVFGQEYKGDGTYAIVGPSPTQRKWYAEVTVTNGLISKVK